LILHASELLTIAGRPSPRTREAASDLGLIEDGAVYTAGDRIVDVGTTSEVLSRHPRASAQIDATGKVVMPGFVDPHTHPLFAGTREHEVEWKSEGLTYSEIAARGGGILQTVRATRDATQAELAQDGAARLRAMAAHGTTTVEAKSGYGLRTVDELKILRAIAEAGRIAGLDVVPTFLGAHAIPSEFDGRPEGYIDLVAAGVPVAIGTDFNPNTWCESMQLVIALACHHNGLLPAEAITAATINAAHAIGRERDVGSIESGKLADLLILDMPSWRHLGYRLGGNAVETVVKRGRVFDRRRLAE